MKQRDYVAYVGAGLVIIVMLIVVFNGINVTGNAVSRTKGSCSDTEQKNDIYQFGIVNMEHRLGTDTYSDECLSDGKHLRQYFCGGPSRLNSLSHFCVKGCSEGVCIK